MKKIFSGILSFLILFSFSFAETEPVSKFNTENLDLFRQLIQELYYKDVTDEELYEAALKGMFQSLDSYSTYYNKEESEEFSTNVSGQYSGIGVKFEGYNNYMRIVKVFVNSPAHKCGLFAGDYIVGVNGESIEGWSSNKVASLIRGEAGTSVDLQILREQQIIKVSVMRENIQAESCDFKVLGENADIGYIKIEEFNAGTSAEVIRYLKFIKGMNTNKVILDLRDNSGGYVDQAVAVAKEIVPKGIITTLKYKNEDKNKVYRSYLEEPYFKIVVLVNGNTASSSEILVGALKDTGAATVIGTTTYGKGVFQNVYSLVGGGSIKITTGAYYTPLGTCIDKIGIEPHIVVENVDEQLNKAIEEVNK